MAEDLEGWKTQIRKGYLELCILVLIQKHKRLYGFDLLEKLSDAELPLKEGTLYPMLNRMTAEKTLQAVWETENIKGHPRKFYSLTREGTRSLEAMKQEYEKMLQIYKAVQK
ncbi:MAG: PadR family transcriptional regulator [Bdellovibrionales bacterium]|nr:PadR family transcriptional regulator [Bdellovibrionales bacterium]